MEYYPLSLLYYLLALALTYYFARRYETEKKNKTQNLFFSFLVVFLFCALRFWVGNDYVGYYETFKESTPEWEIRVEPSFWLLNRFFSGFAYGYLGVFAFSSFLSLFFVYKILVKYNIVSLGILMYFTLEFLIFTNDALRQGIAVSILVYGYQFLVEKKRLKYVLCVAMAFTFHYTACVMLILIFLGKLKIPAKVYYIAWLSSMVLHYSGVLEPLIQQSMVLMPMYGESYAMKHQNQFEAYSSNSGLGVLFKMLLCLYAIKNLKNTDNNYFVHLFIIGSILHHSFNGFMLADRLVLYMVFANIVAMPLVLKNESIKLYKQVVVSVILLYYSLQSLFALESHGAVPYRTLFFEDLNKPHYEYVNDE